MYKYTGTILLRMGRFDFANLGYGSRDMRAIPPNSTLIFDVELLEVK